MLKATKFSIIMLLSFVLAISSGANSVLATPINGGTGTACATYGCLYIKDNDGTNRAIIDGGGFMDIKAGYDTTVTGSGTNDFIIKNSGGTVVFWIDDATGAMHLGSVTDDTQAYCSVSGGYFIIQRAGNCVAYVSNTGALWLRGRLHYNAPI